MLASNPEYVSLRASRHDHSTSPSCRTPLKFQTPPRFSGSLTYDSPMLTPSPLRRHDLPSAEPMDMDDIFQSPASPAYSLQPRREYSTRLRPQVVATDDEDDPDDNSFLAPSSSFSFTRNMAPPTSPLPLRTPLRTPVRQLSRHPGTPDRPVLSVMHLNSLASKSPAAGTGTKRKPTPSLCTTPLRNRTLTPLTVTSAVTQKQGDTSAVGFDRLAPLPAPRFNPRSPSTNAEADLHLKRQAETMTMLKISDMQRTGDESGYDSGPEGREPDDPGQRLFEGGAPGATPFSGVKPKGKGKVTDKSPALKLFIRTGQVNNEEVAEAISPGGHITKRRARSRPVSSELLECAQNTPHVFENQANARPNIYESQSASSVAFPSARARRPSASSSTSSETGSPVPRHRLTPGALPRIRTQSQSSRVRTSMNRMASASSATLFFGPAIPNQRSTKKPSHKPSLAAGTSSHHLRAPTALQVLNRSLGERPKALNRHSYGSPDTSVHGTWQRAEQTSSSPVSSPNLRKRPDESSDDEDLFFGGPADTSFTFSVTAGTPSPKKKQKRETASPLPKKFRPRDSGIALYSSDDDGGLRLFRDDLFMPAMPRASTSVSTVNSEGEDQALVTPGFGPSTVSGWPGTEVNVATLSDDSADDMDAFILRTLASGAGKSAQGHDEPKRVPGTPVKKLRTAHLVQRPWQSAVTSKIGFPEFDDDLPKGGKKGKGKPRKSLPAAFPMMGKENRTAGKGRVRDGHVRLDSDVAGDGDDEDVSPSASRDRQYDGLGIGRPSGVIPPFARPCGESKGGKGHWLMRRSSSGAFSSGGDSSGSNTVTPTRANTKAWGLPPPRLPTPVSPLKNRLDFSEGRATPTSTSTSTSTSSTALNSPTVAASTRHLRTGASALPQPTPVRAPVFARPQTHAHPARLPFGHPSPPRMVGVRGRLSIPTSEEQPGRFDREFIEVDELGTGEFGRVMKVRYKEDMAPRGKEGEHFAVKKSKRFEGAKHRLRLREEVDILSHLSRRGGQSSVLAYIDSWEEDETLYIRTELCSLGNFAHFLLAYGRSYPRLDEGRVWRILAELSAGLHFIHDAGVIHLDLKPANIFITGSGRLKIGDFGMASLWPRLPPPSDSIGGSAFEREGDKLYLAPEVLQGRYGKAADVFSLGMTMLETATNVIVPDQGDSWHRLRREDFSQVDSGLASLSAELRELLRSMMRTEPASRAEIGLVASNPVVSRARAAMDHVRSVEGDVFSASPLGGVGKSFLNDILHPNDWEDDDMEVGP